MTLSELAVKHGSDKHGHHYYTETYERIFAHLKDEHLNLLEIGIGGDDDTTAGGASLKMWADWFTNARIFGVDLYDKRFLDDSRIITLQGNQSDKEFLHRVLINTLPRLKIIIDDGSHVCSDVITTFEFLYPHLPEGGLYIIEDIECSYWNTHGGNPDFFNDTTTTMGYFKMMLDKMNRRSHRYYTDLPDKWEYDFKYITFCRNLIIIEKGENR